MQSCWNAASKIHVGEGWGKDVFRQTEEAYGVVDTKERDEKTRRVLAAVVTGGFDMRIQCLVIQVLILPIPQPVHIANFQSALAIIRKA